MSKTGLEKNVPAHKNGFNSTALAKPRKPKTFKMAKYAFSVILGTAVSTKMILGVVATAIGIWPIGLFVIGASAFMGHETLQTHKGNMKSTTWTTEAGQTLSAPKWAKDVYNEIQTSLYDLYQKDQTQPKVQKKLAKIHQTAQDLEAYLTVLDNNNTPDPEAKVEYLTQQPLKITRTTTQTVVTGGSVITADGHEKQQQLEKPKKKRVYPPFSVV